jgi:hypothetical protein
MVCVYVYFVSAYLMLLTILLFNFLVSVCGNPRCVCLAGATTNIVIVHCMGFGKVVSVGTEG